MKSVSFYNMELCPDAETAFAHAEEHHMSQPLGFLAVTVGECLEVGGTVRFDHDTMRAYHVSLYLSEDRTERDAQKKQLLKFAELRGIIYPQPRKPR